MPWELAVEREGRVLRLHGLAERVIVFCRVTAAGTVCSARMQRLDPRLRRWVFTKWELYVCVTAHWEYCKRRDRTRNLDVEAIACEPVPPPPPKRYHVIPRRGEEMRRIEEAYARFVEEWLLKTAYDLAMEAEGVVDKCLDCFGLSVRDAETGYHWETEDKTRCCYGRCGYGRRRCARRGCTFK